jgi:hypothetical protein
MILLYIYLCVFLHNDIRYNAYLCGQGFPDYGTQIPLPPPDTHEGATAETTYKMYTSMFPCLFMVSRKRFY